MKVFISKDGRRHLYGIAPNATVCNLAVKKRTGETMVLSALQVITCPTCVTMIRFCKTVPESNLPEEPA